MVRPVASTSIAWRKAASFEWQKILCELQDDNILYRLVKDGALVRPTVFYVALSLAQVFNFQTASQCGQ